jgi:hypothetical protein
VAFSSGLQLHGDACTDFDAAAMAVEGDHLESCDELRAAGQAAASRGGASCQAVSAASEGLIERLYTLEEGGGTALGPAICVALGMAQGVAGSKVIVCTDGLANIGVGALDELDTDAATEQATAFYAALGNEAAAQGCSIDVVALEGDGCDVENLGVMSEAAGGTVSKLDPTKLVDEFAAILAEPVLATRCTLTMHLHAGLRFRNEDELAEEAAAAAAGTSALQHHHVLVKQIGNVTASSEVSVEFGLAPQRATVGLELPFQSQLRFTRADGSVVTRVQTAIMPVTQDSALAEAQANPALLAARKCWPFTPLRWLRRAMPAQFLSYAPKRLLISHHVYRMALVLLQTLRSRQRSWGSVGTTWPLESTRSLTTACYSAAVWRGASSVPTPRGAASRPVSIGACATSRWRNQCLASATWTRWWRGPRAAARQPS